jgi:tetratricopeptide (TPR) repeat protein
MKKLLIFFVITIFSYQLSTVYAQKQGQVLIDSLLKELLQDKDDKNKINMLSNISFEYRSINPGNGIIFGNQGLELAEKLEWKIGMANNYNALGANYYSSGSYDLALKNYQIALKLNEEINRKNKIASNLGNIGLIYQSLGRYNKALETYKTALSISNDLNNQRGMAQNLGNIGALYYYQYKWHSKNYSEYGKYIYS